MAGFTKLFEDIVRSTIWREPDSTRLLWITMLAICDREGVVSASVPGLADTARIKLEECVEGLRVLSGPDKWSRSQEHGGRRIREVDGGWEILNYRKYREKFSAAERREYKRVKQREYREKGSGPGKGNSLAGQDGSGKLVKRKVGSPNLARERLKEACIRTGDLATLARLEEMEDHVAPGAYGSYGPEAQAVVNRGQSPQEESKSLPDNSGIGGEERSEVAQSGGNGEPETIEEEGESPE